MNQARIEALLERRRHAVTSAEAAEMIQDADAGLDWDDLLDRLLRHFEAANGRVVGSWPTFRKIVRAWLNGDEPDCSGSANMDDPDRR